MSDVSSWYPAAASNTAAAPDGWPEGMSPADVNNCAREMMAAVKRSAINRMYSSGLRAGTVAGAGFGTTCYMLGRRPFYYDSVSGYTVIAGQNASSGKGAIAASFTPWLLTSMVDKTSGATPFYAVCGNGLGTLWVAVGASGVIYSSTDLSTWTSRTSGVATGLNYVHFANSLWVAVGDSGVILTSSDAITWDARTSALPGHLYGITYGASKWVVVGAYNTVGIAQSSSDGITWTERNTGLAIDGSYTGVAFANSKFVLGSTGAFPTHYPHVYTSTDGTSWSLVYTGVDPSVGYGGIGPYTAPIYDLGSWIVPGYYGIIVSHDNCATWSIIPHALPQTVAVHRTIFRGASGMPPLGSDGSGNLYVYPAAY